MYRLNEILNAFSTLVGWEGTENLERSDSGLFFQDAHPLLTLRAMEAIAPKTIPAKYREYNALRAYSKGEIIRNEDKLYKSLIDGNNYHLSTPTAWLEINLFEAYLDSLTRAGIKKMVTKFVNDKVANLESKNIVDRRALFDGAGRKTARNENRRRLVGFELTPLRSHGITTIINKVGLQFTGNVGKVTLYLFHSSRIEPIQTKEVEITRDGSFMWFDLDWALPYMSEDINAGGSWYIVYNEAELAPYMESINFGRDWSREPCGTCNKGDVNLYRLMQKYITLTPFYVAMDNWDGKLWDIEQCVVCNTNNFGMNFLTTISCDLTDSILLERAQFAPILQMQVATDALRALALNPEVSVNRLQMNADRNNILYELDGNGQGIKGLSADLEKAYKALSMDTKGLDEVCLACHNKGVRYSSI